jgi:hypothetical protein
MTSEELQKAIADCVAVIKLDTNYNESIKRARELALVQLSELYKAQAIQAKEPVMIYKEPTND